MLVVIHGIWVRFEELVIDLIFEGDVSRVNIAILEGLFLEC